MACITAAALPVAFRSIVPRRCSILRRAAARATQRGAAAAVSSSTPPPAPVRSVLGTMTFGWKFASEECGDDASRQMMEAFLSAGHTEVDTAFAYSGGETEKIMGRVFDQHPSLLTTMSIATKANPWQGLTLSTLLAPP